MIVVCNEQKKACQGVWVSHNICVLKKFEGMKLKLRDSPESQSFVHVKHKFKQFWIAAKWQKTKKNNANNFFSIYCQSLKTIVTLVMSKFSVCIRLNLLKNKKRSFWIWHLQHVTSWSLNMTPAWVKIFKSNKHLKKWLSFLKNKTLFLWVQVSYLRSLSFFLGDLCVFERPAKNILHLSTNKDSLKKDDNHKFGLAKNFVKSS